MGNEGKILIKKAKELGAVSVHCYLDSELVVKQMNQEYKVKQPHLQKLFVYFCVVSDIAISFLLLVYMPYSAFSFVDVSDAFFGMRHLERMFLPDP